MKIGLIGMNMHWFKILLPYAAGLLLLVALQAKSETVVHEISSLNLKAEAEYIAGNEDKTAVLILHGFLTTNKFHTVTAMAKTLQGEGYTTLTPTLTLNISQRQQSLKCNSIHTHTLEKDVTEITEWIKFLHDKGHKKIVLIGHSSGSQELIEFLNTHKEFPIEAAIFTSLFYFVGSELGTIQSEIDYARQALTNKQDSPHKYSFLFCKSNYYALPESFLSYQKIDRSYTLDSLKNLSIPSYTIMGSADKRYQSVGENWLKDLEKTGTQLIVIDGANHFFSSVHEFDLQDAINKIINNL
jgi:esterase/lipase